MKDSILIIGAGEQGRVVLDIFRARGKFDRILGFVDDLAGKNSVNREIEDKPVLGNLGDLETLVCKGAVYAHPASGDPARRRKARDAALTAGLKIISAVHPFSFVSGMARIGEGSCVCPGAVVCTGAILGSCVIVNTGATIDHDCRVGDFVHIAGGAHVSSKVTVEEDAFIGVGASVAQKPDKRIVIGRGAIVAPGAVVDKDVPPGMKVAGIPAREMK